MGTWFTLHYGGPIETGLTKSLCGRVMGDPQETRQVATYRRYELEEPEHFPAAKLPPGSIPCATCRDALLIDRARDVRLAKQGFRDRIARARRLIPRLIESGKWRRVETIAHDAWMAAEMLKHSSW